MRGAKSVANKRIAAQLSPLERVPVASIASKGAKIGASVIVPRGAKQSPEDLPAKKLNMPPLWNACYSSCCQVLRFVGNGGALVGKCALCGNGRPRRRDVMLDPEQLAELRMTPRLLYDVLTGSVSHPPSGGLLPSHPRGQARNSPQKFMNVPVGKGRGITSEQLGESKSGSLLDEDDSVLSHSSPPRASWAKTASMFEGDLGLSPDNSPLFLRDGDDCPATPTDNEVSRYSFFDQLKHYMEGNPITEGNRVSVELCILLRLELRFAGWTQ